jgi:N-acetyl-anhydromuramyl-L-alanine amidase AmpD
MGGPNVNPAWSRSAYLGLILHVQQGNGALQGWFSNPNAQASAHFQVLKDGEVLQFVPTNICAWAEMAGNPFYSSVETEGYPSEPLTNAQVVSLGKLLAWEAKERGYALQLANAPGQ